MTTTTTDMRTLASIIRAAALYADREMGIDECELTAVRYQDSRAVVRVFSLTDGDEFCMGLVLDHAEWGRGWQVCEDSLPASTF